MAKTKKEKGEHKFFKDKHTSIEKYGLLAKPLKKKPTLKKFGRSTLAILNKENLGVDEEYQRKLDHKQISNILATYDSERCDIPAVYLHEHTDGLIYPQITEGQHRVCGSPYKDQEFKVVNHLSSVERCFQANDPSTTRNWTKDDIYWIKKVDIERNNKPDDEHIIGFIDFHKKLGYNPVHPKKHKKTDIGGNIAKLHFGLTKIFDTMFRKRNLFPNEKIRLYKKGLNDTLEIIHRVFENELQPCWKRPKDFGGTIWGGLYSFLHNPEEDLGLGGMYDKEEIIKLLKKGKWGIRGTRARKNPLKCFDDYKQAFMEYKVAKIVTNRETQTWEKLFFDMHTLSQKL